MVELEPSPDDAIDLRHVRVLFQLVNSNGECFWNDLDANRPVKNMRSRGFVTVIGCEPRPNREGKETRVRITKDGREFLHEVAHWMNRVAARLLDDACI